ncbi:MAG: ABC transporter permease [Candidatus Tectomicrobia bacterium]|uniref:Transport permease protein n=1 Tax=Tectimicrobiota bacterium TaxID=2528274 RepID=A0A932I2R8_UNCTE|nr:ABC transporter permease [Candidatus Tectomicrobia bacterium]
MSEFLQHAPSHRAVRVWIRHLVMYRSWFIAEWAGSLTEHALYLLAFGYGLGRFVPDMGGMAYAQFIGPGLVVSIAMWSASYESTYGAYSRMRLQHIYEGMLSAPLTIGDVVLGDLLWCASRSLIGAVLMLIVLSAFGLVGSPWAAAVLPVVFIEALMFAGLGLIATALAPSHSFFNFHYSLIVMPMFFFAGTFFPLQGLPAWMQTVSELMPLTHAVILARGLIVYGHAPDALWHLFMLSVFTLGFLAVACGLVGRRMLD